MVIGTKRFSHKKAKSHKRKFSAESRPSAPGNETEILSVSAFAEELSGSAKLVMQHCVEEVVEV